MLREIKIMNQFIICRIVPTDNSRITLASKNMYNNKHMKNDNEVSKEHEIVRICRS